MRGLWVLSMVAGSACASPLSDYQLHCMGCHGATGSGDVSRVPSANEAFRRFAATESGQDYLIRVPGIATSPLSDARLTALLNWLLSESGGNAGARVFSVKQVAEARLKPLADVKAARLRAMLQSP